jgi:hypothetical protein
MQTIFNFKEETWASNILESARVLEQISHKYKGIATCFFLQTPEMLTIIRNVFLGKLIVNKIK